MFFFIHFAGCCRRQLLFYSNRFGRFERQRADDGTFSTSECGILSINGRLGLHDDKAPPDIQRFWNVFVADEAFPLLRSMMRLYPGRKLGPILNEYSTTSFVVGTSNCGECFRHFTASRFSINHRAASIPAQQTKPSRQLVSCTICCRKRQLMATQLQSTDQEKCQKLTVLGSCENCCRSEIREY
jgi:hypothetical protein